jgi:dimethylaniline monooxygenase (N-oxide forming)
VTEQKRVAVIGAGIAGLVTAKVLRDDAFDVVVFEQEPTIGGVWAATRTYPRASRQQLARYLQVLRSPLRTVSGPISNGRASAPVPGLLRRPVRTGTADPALAAWRVTSWRCAPPRSPNPKYPKSLGHRTLQARSCIPAGPPIRRCWPASVSLWSERASRRWTARRGLPRSPTTALWSFATRIGWRPATYRAGFPSTGCGVERVLHGPGRILSWLFWRLTGLLFRAMLCMPAVMVPDQRLPLVLENVGLAPEFYRLARRGRVRLRRDTIEAFGDGAEIGRRGPRRRR